MEQTMAASPNTLTGIDPSSIVDYHAHVYYEAETKPAAAQLRKQIEQRFGVALGSWHDQPVGPHPMGSYQITFPPEEFSALVPWLALNRNGLVIFLHPNTGDDLPDHRDRAIWMGAKMELNLSKL